jgi:hypothetical protein
MKNRSNKVMEEDDKENMDGTHCLYRFLNSLKKFGPKVLE